MGEWEAWFCEITSFHLISANFKGDFPIFSFVNCSFSLFHTEEQWLPPVAAMPVDTGGASSASGARDGRDGRDAMAGMGCYRVAWINVSRAASQKSQCPKMNQFRFQNFRSLIFIRRIRLDPESFWLLVELPCFSLFRWAQAIFDHHHSIPQPFLNWAMLAHMRHNKKNNSWCRIMVSRQWYFFEPPSEKNIKEWGSPLILRVAGGLGYHGFHGARCVWKVAEQHWVNDDFSWDQLHVPWWFMVWEP